jgi:hypothetical protein
MNKNEQLAEQSLAAQQGFFGKLTDVEPATLPAAYSKIQITDGWKVDGNGVATRSEPIPACIQLHIPTATGTAGQTKFDTQGPYGKHVYGLPVIPESVDDIRYKKPAPEEYGWEPNSTTSSNGWPDEDSQGLYEEAMLEWQRDLFLAYGSKEPQVPNHVKDKEFVSPLDAYLRTLSSNCTMVGDSQNAGTAGETHEEEIQTPIMSDSMLALYGAILEDFYAGTPGNPKEEIQKLRQQFRELITDNAKGTYKRGSNGQLIADEVCVEGLIDDLVEFFNQQPQNNEPTKD